MNKIKNKKKLTSIILFIISVAAYYRATSAYFVADDFFYLYQRNNPDFYSPFTHFFYQPITLGIYYLNYFWAGFDHFKYHWFVIILNGLNNIIFFNIAYLLTGGIFRAFIISLLSAIYYFSADNMIWINCTNNVLCAFFYFLSILYSIKFNNSKQKKHLIFMLLFLNSALYTREMGVSLFIVLIILDAVYFFRKKTLSLDFKFFLKKHSFVVLSGFIYIFIMALGPTFRYKKLSFDRGAYELIFDIKSILININWFFFRTFIPFSFGSHFKFDIIHNIIQIVRFNYISLISIFILSFIIRNRHFYFGVLWILITASPYLLLNIYFVHTGERYFYLPHMGLGFMLIGIWIYLKNYLKNVTAKKITAIFLMLILVLYSVVSFYAIQHRINSWIDAGNISYRFLDSVKKTFSDIPENSVLFIKNVPRWRSSPPKLIVLITGASFALNLHYEKKNIEVVPYWEDAGIENYEFLNKKFKFYNYYLLEYENGIIKKWNPDTKYNNSILKYTVENKMKKIDISSFNLTHYQIEN